MTHRFTNWTTKRTAKTNTALRTTKFTGGLVAFSLIVAGFSSAPAHADEGDVARAVGGLLALYAVGKVIDNATDDNHRDNRRASSHRSTTDRSTSDRSGTRRSVTPQPTGKASNAFHIPNQCVTTARDTRRRQQTVALENCVLKDRRSARALPNACEIRVQTSRGRTHAYELGCLTNFGYRVTRS